jgi:Spy/CpxP family protein refolding chaperone
MRILLFVLGFIIASETMAQKGTANLSPSEKTDKFIKHWTKELNLTAEQQTRATPIITKMYTRMGQLRLDTAMDMNAKKAAMMETRKIGVNGFKTVLTPEQSALYDKKMQQLMGKRKGVEKKAMKNKGKSKEEKDKTKKAIEEELENEDLF